MELINAGTVAKVKPRTGLKRDNEWQSRRASRRTRKATRNKKYIRTRVNNFPQIHTEEKNSANMIKKDTDDQKTRKNT